MAAVERPREMTEVDPYSESFGWQNSKDPCELAKTMW